MVYDVSFPRGRPNGAGVVFVVSGGFLSTVEQQELVQPVAEPLLDAGFAIFHLRHPSTPRYMAPEIYDAVQQGTAHILEHAPDHGVDPRRVGVMGMSTGGLLALLLGLDQPTTSEFGDRPSAVVAYMPIVDMRDVVGQVQATPSLGFDPELAPGLSPIDHASSDDPPTLLIHGEKDQIVPIDTSGRASKAAARDHTAPPHIWVMDQSEAEDLAGRPIADMDALQDLAMEFRNRNLAEIVVLSFAEGGAVAISATETHRILPPKVEVVSKVGAGDSFVAGLTMKLAQGASLRIACAFAVAAAASAVTTPATELCDGPAAERYFNMIMNGDA